MNYKGGTTLKIKDVSEQLQISPDTLRYYEKIGLIRNVPRDKNGVRDYSEENCKSIAFIKCMRAANVSISGLTRYMELFEQGDATRQGAAGNFNPRTPTTPKQLTGYPRRLGPLELEN